MTTKNNELLHNGSGYTDFTAYKAIKNLEGEDDEVEFYKGEIYDFETPNSSAIRKALVVSANYRKAKYHLSAIVLEEEKKGIYAVEIVTKNGTMYANPEMVSFVKRTSLTSFHKLATDEEMNALDKGIMKALGLCGAPSPKVIENIIESPATEELAVARAEAKIYKEMYDALLVKFVSRAV